MKVLMNDKYLGWDLISMQNKWIKLYLIPQIGGGIIQYEMNHYGFFFVNPSLLGRLPGPSRLGENQSWLNFGGEKIWPWPQGWNSPEQWPGPPDPILDTGVYSLQKEPRSNITPAVTLRSPYDPYTGLQIIKDISLSSSRSEATVKATFCNKSKIPRKWSVWPVCQMNTPDLEEAQNYRIICPTYSESKFKSGYSVLHGLANNPQNKIDDYNNLIVEYQYLVGKVGLDSRTGWLAYLDRKRGRVFVLMFDYQSNEIYPDSTSVHIWTQGRGNIYSRNRIIDYQNDLVLNPPYVEMELLSPLKLILPGDSFQFSYRMLCSIIPVCETIKRISNYGIVALPLTLSIRKTIVNLTAKYGFFSDGKIKISIEKSSVGKILCLYETTVSPARGADINLDFEKKLIEGQDVFLTVNFYDQNSPNPQQIDEMKINVT